MEQTTLRALESRSNVKWTLCVRSPALVPPSVSLSSSLCSTLYPVLSVAGTEKRSLASESACAMTNRRSRYW